MSEDAAQAPKPKTPALVRALFGVGLLLLGSPLLWSGVGFVLGARPTPSLDAQLGMLAGLVVPGLGFAFSGLRLIVFCKAPPPVQAAHPTQLLAIGLFYVGCLLWVLLGIWDDRLGAFAATCTLPLLVLVCFVCLVGSRAATNARGLDRKPNLTVQFAVAMLALLLFGLAVKVAPRVKAGDWRTPLEGYRDAPADVDEPARPFDGQLEADDPRPR